LRMGAEEGDDDFLVEDDDEEDWVPGELNLRKEVVVRCGGRALRLAQDGKSPMCGAVVWEVAVILAKLMDHGQWDVQGKVCLELGSGTGAAGLALAAHGCRVVFTDLPALVPHLEANVRRNLGGDSGRKGASSSSTVVAYDWTEPLPRRLRETHFDLILATDTVYHEHLVDPFLSALRAVPCHLLLLIYERRDDDVLRNFEAHLKTIFKAKRLNLAKLRRTVPGLANLLQREDDVDWLTILECRRRKNILVKKEPRRPSSSL